MKYFKFLPSLIIIFLSVVFSFLILTEYSVVRGGWQCDDYPCSRCYCPGGPGSCVWCSNKGFCDDGLWKNEWKDVESCGGGGGGDPTPTPCPQPEKCITNDWPKYTNKNCGAINCRDNDTPDRCNRWFIVNNNGEQGCQWNDSNNRCEETGGQAFICGQGLCSNVGNAWDCTATLGCGWVCPGPPPASIGGVDLKFDNKNGPVNLTNSTSTYTGTLSWTVSGVANGTPTCSASCEYTNETDPAKKACSEFSGTKSNLGNQSATPTTTVKYTISCSNGNTVTDSVQVNVMRYRCLFGICQGSSKGITNTYKYGTKTNCAVSCKAFIPER